MFQLRGGFLSLPVCFQMYVLLCVYMKKGTDKDFEQKTEGCCQPQSPQEFVLKVSDDLNFRTKPP